MIISWWLHDRNKKEKRERQIKNLRCAERVTADRENIHEPIRLWDVSADGSLPDGRQCTQRTSTWQKQARARLCTRTTISGSLWTRLWVPKLPWLIQGKILPRWLRKRKEKKKVAHERLVIMSAIIFRRESRFFSCVSVHVLHKQLTVNDVAMKLHDHGGVFKP